jgi:hypothetical protein
MSWAAIRDCYLRIVTDVVALVPDMTAATSGGLLIRCLRAAALSRPQEHHAYGALHRIGTRSVQGVLAGLTVSTTGLPSRTKIIFPPGSDDKAALKAMNAIRWLAIHWLELGAGVLLAGFMAFAFRQGMKVKASRSRRTAAGKARAIRLVNEISGLGSDGG